MPGAQPSANPAKREEFEQRCRSSIADIADGAGKKKGNQSVDEIPGDVSSRRLLKVGMRVY